MITEKYFNTESNVILVGKKAKTGGTSLLATLGELVRKDGAFPLRYDFEGGVASKSTIDYLGGIVKGLCMALGDSKEIVILLDEVTSLDAKVLHALESSISVWVEMGNISVVCVGDANALLFSPTFSAEYLKLTDCADNIFSLINGTGESMFIGS